MEPAMRVGLDIPGFVGKTKAGKKTPKAVLDAGYNLVNNIIHLRPSTVLSGSGITLLSDEIKDIVEVIRYLENRGILLKGTTKKMTSQDGELLNILRPLC